MGKDNRVKVEEVDIDDDDLSPKDKKAAKIRAELEKKQREKRLKNSESKRKNDASNTRKNEEN